VLVLLDLLQGRLDLGRLVRTVHSGQELLDHDGEQHPVALPRPLSDETGKPGHHSLPHRRVEPVEQPGASLVQRQRDRRRLHDLLRAVRRRRPHVPVAGIGAVRVPLDERGRLSASPGDAESGEQERAGTRCTATAARRLAE
jgi:hypothetical protein